MSHVTQQLFELFSVLGKSFDEKNLVTFTPTFLAIILCWTTDLIQRCVQRPTFLEMGKFKSSNRE